MKLLTLLMLMSYCCYGQQSRIDSIEKQIEQKTELGKVICNMAIRYVVADKTKEADSVGIICQRYHIEIDSLEVELVRERQKLQRVKDSVEKFYIPIDKTLPVTDTSNYYYWRKPRIDTVPVTFWYCDTALQRAIKPTTTMQYEWYWRYDYSVKWMRGFTVYNSQTFSETYLDADKVPLPKSYIKVNVFNHQ